MRNLLKNSIVIFVSTNVIEKDTLEPINKHITKKRYNAKFAISLAATAVFEHRDPVITTLP